ncbi:MAG TPA: hypothetical protein DDW90_00260 [Cyanobacteria bacterium UBA9971]|nr:hypothetical protein [Cyanobacteria bacterium UBA9971]
MNVSGISNSRLGFSGTYGTADRINKDGSRTHVTFNLTDDDAFLSISNNNDGDRYTAKLLIKGKEKQLDGLSKMKNLENLDTDIRYEHIKIDKIDKLSKLNVYGYSALEIKTMKDNANVLLGGSEKDHGFAKIDKIEGENAEIKLNENSGVSINQKSEFNLKSHYVQADRSQGTRGYVKVVGEGLNIKG